MKGIKLINEKYLGSGFSTQSKTTLGSGPATENGRKSAIFNKKGHFKFYHSAEIFANAFRTNVFQV